MSKAHGIFIGGEWHDGVGTEPNVNPSDTRDIVGDYAQADASHVAAAVSAARAAFPSWSATTPQQRSEILDRAGTELLARSAELGRLLSREEGKTLPEGVGEVTRAGQLFKFFAAEAVRLSGTMGASTRPGIGIEVTREPVGVFGLITPWNFPIAIPAWKLAPALAFGNCVVLKPSEFTPACAVVLVEILAKAGLPAGVLNLVNGPGHVVGQALVASSGVDGISFTGSVATGRGIAQAAAARMARVQCEMGGKNPLVVLDDADLDVAVNCALNGAFFSTGQRCTASSRLVVTPGIHDRFVSRLVERLRALKVDHALKDGTEMGPAIHEAQLEKDLRYVGIATSEGATLACGGERLQRDTPGWYLSPALLTDTTNGSRINREEVFGPVASVIRVRDYDEALAVSNDTEFGLCAGLCTTSLKHATHFRRAAQAGLVMINLPTAGLDYHLPFGGRKASSYGPREQGEAAREFYTQGKTAYVSA
ncbi:aldehyde dehydrogenase (NAD+) [Panacagrimonas perspica]|uniref:Aldehyde dehydrogenase (NAD+) n=1 Tax=Panacagrimonas perspica TaxID=381431 RepID=A0A4S3K5K2_9GAMM|nr:aldehyde dehydrogenase family protein [Panacagrimonas perspica]TDU28540.1 aldehyde dehydrogenase (NAD+) [Panacagrimonas perspica]THD03400.1 aldehyde dehydrogenase family protein [Panacagrimonas perspica]